MALGASRRADVFEDYPGEEFQKNYDGEGEQGHGDSTEFREDVLKNLNVIDVDIIKIKNLEPGEVFTCHEFWGISKLTITFQNVDGQIICNFNEDETFICKF
jgi:hypothetical protein